jgi:hypothetical protein
MAFATTDDLATYLGRAVENTAQGDMALALATGIIRAETGQTLSLVEDDEVQLRGSAYAKLALPERPVLAVTSVSGDSINTDEWSRQGANLTRWYGWPDVVTVTYSHGYAVIPDDVKAITLAVAARILTANDPSGPSIAREQIGSYSVEYARSSDTSAESAFLTDGERAHLRRTYRPAVGTVTLR